MSYCICVFPKAAALAHNVTYEMLLRVRILSNYFQLEILLVMCGGLCLAKMSQTDGRSHVAGQRDAVGKSQGSS